LINLLLASCFGFTATLSLSAQQPVFHRWVILPTIARDQASFSLISCKNKKPAASSSSLLNTSQSQW